MEDILLFMEQNKDGSSWVLLAWIAGKILDYLMKRQDSIKDGLEVRVKSLEEDKQNCLDKYNSLYKIFLECVDANTKPKSNE